MSSLQSGTLIPAGKARLAELESVIERGRKTFLEVGRALIEIRNQRLYREQGFTTFDTYCRERWKMSQPHAQRTIDAAKVAQNLIPMGITVQTERQARELAPLPPEQQREVAAGIDFTKATAKEVHVAVEKALTVAKDAHATVKAVKTAPPATQRAATIGARQGHASECRHAKDESGRLPYAWAMPWASGVQCRQGRCAYE